MKIMEQDFLVSDLKKTFLITVLSLLLLIVIKLLSLGA